MSPGLFLLFLLPIIALSAFLWPCYIFVMKLTKRISLERDARIKMCRHSDGDVCQKDDGSCPYEKMCFPGRK